MITIAIDFDGVIHNPKRRERGRVMGTPYEGAIAALDELTERGFKLIIYTVRGTTKPGQQTVRQWLDYYDAPDCEVTALKPNADLYIDDRAIHHVAWPQTLRETYDRLGVDSE